MESNENKQHILEDLSHLRIMVSNIHEKIPNIKRSDSETSELNELYAALAKAQGEMETAKTDSSNPFFKSKYADLLSVIKSSRPHLAKNGLCVIQRVVTEDKGNLALYTRLCHASGQWIESKMPINPPKSDIQSLGSYISYLRRYNYSTIVGVVAGDEDDDGECTMDHPEKKEFISEEDAAYFLQKINQEILPHDAAYLKRMYDTLEVKDIREVEKKHTKGIEKNIKLKIDQIKGKGQ